VAAGRLNVLKGVFNVIGVTAGISAGACMGVDAMPIKGVSTKPIGVSKHHLAGMHENEGFPC